MRIAVASMLALTVACASAPTGGGKVDRPHRFTASAIVSADPSFDGVLVSAGYGAKLESIVRAGVDAVERQVGSGVVERRAAATGELGLRMRALGLMSPRASLPRRFDFGLDGSTALHVDELARGGITGSASIGLWVSASPWWLADEPDFPHVELQLRRHTSSDARDGTDVMIGIGWSYRDEQYDEPTRWGGRPRARRVAKP